MSNDKPNENGLKEKIDKFIEEISEFFNAEITNAEARESGFVERESKLTGHLFLSIFTFGMSIYGTPSLNDLVGLLKLIVPELEITRQGLHERINDGAVKFFEKMLSYAINIEIPKTLELSDLSQFERILIFDSTSFQLPEELADYFKGSGGDASDSAVKILFGYDLKSSRFFYLILNGTDPDHFIKSGLIDEISHNDLEISDLGFFNIEVFAQIDQKGAFYLSRFRSDVNLYQENQEGELEKFDLAKFVKKMEVNQTEIELYLKKGEIITKTRLIIEKVPEEVKGKRLRKINKTNKKKGRKTKEQTKILAGFNLYITNTPTHSIQTKHVRAFYGIRWQIELIFKNWKSNFSLDKVTGKKLQRIKCMIYAKLLFIFITTKIVSALRNYVWITCKREVSSFQASKHLKIVANIWLFAIIQQPQNIQIILHNATNFIIKYCLKGKSKKRTYPLELLEIIQKSP